MKFGVLAHPGGIAETEIVQSTATSVLTLCVFQVDPRRCGWFSVTVDTAEHRPGLFPLSFWLGSLFCVGHGWFGFLADPQGESQ